MPVNFLDRIFGRFGNRLFQSAYIYARYKDGLIPDIYLQDLDYFDKYREDLKRIFGEGVGYDPRVSIHVRRGTNPVNSAEPAYSENPFYVNLAETDYYLKAMDLFPGKKFLVFSDAPSWVENSTLFAKCDVAYGNELDDFLLMASCDGHIIANSSYSWWAAYLGKGAVVAPKKWFTNKGMKMKFPKEWVTL